MDIFYKLATKNSTQWGETRTSAVSVKKFSCLDFQMKSHVLRAGRWQRHLPRARSTALSPYTMCQIIGFRKSATPQNHQLVIQISKSQPPQVGDLVSELIF